MSYILDALKKSDQERRRGKVPGINTVQIPSSVPGSKRRILLPGLLLTALVLNAGIFLWWIRPWQPERRAAGVHEAAAVKSVPDDRELPGASPNVTLQVHAPPRDKERDARAEPDNAGVSSAPVSLPTAVPPSPPAGAVPREKAEHAEVPRKGGDESAAMVDRKPIGKASQQATAPPPDESAARPAARETKKAMEKTTPAQSLEYSAIQAPPASKPSAEALSPPEAQSDPEQTERRFPELPFSVQVKIPRMSISMLVYAKNPPDRMISVNGKMMHEGQEVAPGLKLEQITQSGAVFSYQGHRFHKGVF